MFDLGESSENELKEFSQKHAQPITTPKDPRIVYLSTNLPETSTIHAGSCR